MFYHNNGEGELDKAFLPGICDFRSKRDHEEGWLERMLIILMNSIKVPFMSPPSEAVAHSSNTREHFEVKSQPSCIPSTCPLPLRNDFGYSKADLLHGLCAKAHPSALFRSESAGLVGMRPHCGQKNESP